MNPLDRDPPSSPDDPADEALLAALSELRQDRAPPRDLWASVEARMPSALPEPIPRLNPELIPRIDEHQYSAIMAFLREERGPMRDLWPEIETRIRASRWRRLSRPLTIAASIAATLVFALTLQVQRGSTSATDASQPLAHTPLRAPADVLAAMQEQAPNDAALRPVSTRPLAPEARALVRANLKIVASAEAQLKRALASDPDSAYLERLLETAQQQKQDLRVALAER